ncbi:MAG: YraN family protein [Oligoflexales bacterium]|nr:YraN family protein [Oligoflexales bacterium]
MVRILDLARDAEQCVVELLISQDWSILARNFRRTSTELDIVALKERSLIFTEVKYRKRISSLHEDLRVLVPPRKQAALQRGARIFLTEHPHLVCDAIRFDLALVSQDVSQDVSQLKVVSYYVNIMS